MTTGLPKVVRFPKHTFIVIRAIDTTSHVEHPNCIHAHTKYPLPSKWEEQEIHMIHTADYTWSLPSNSLFTQQVLKTWTTNDKKWHLSLI